MKLASLALALCLVGCGDATSTPVVDTPSGIEFATRFVGERAFRRESLVEAVVNPLNGYSALRLSKYATEDGAGATGWDARDEYHPLVRPLAANGSSEAAEPVWDGRTPSTEAEWLALGRRAFELWPVELDDVVGRFAQDDAARTEYGMWVDDRGRVAGLVMARTADGGEHAAWTCSSCHARPGADGALIYGAPAYLLDRGAMAALAPDGSRPVSWSWGPGVLDVTADGEDDPTAILDLRATAHQSHLHWEATLRNGLPALAVRIESLIIENASEGLRPPHEVAAALALFVQSLGDAANSSQESSNRGDTNRGADVFDVHCSGCHHADGSTGSPVSAAVVGTDPRAANSPMRGNGVYRVPSLWDVSDRGLLLHDGSIRDLAAFLDPARASTQPGHPFGLDLNAGDRESLIAFLGTIGR
jgi:cytochrome c553